MRGYSRSTFANKITSIINGEFLETATSGTVFYSKIKHFTKTTFDVYVHVKVDSNRSSQVHLGSRMRKR